MKQIWNNSYKLPTRNIQNFNPKTAFGKTHPNPPRTINNLRRMVPKHSKWVEDKTKAQETFELLQQSEEDYVKWKEVSIPKPKHLLQIKDPSSWKEKLQIYKDLLQAKTELQHKIEKHFLTKVEPQRTKRMKPLETRTPKL